MYLSGLRFVAQFIVPTDISSLWETSAQRPLEASHLALSTLACLDPLAPDYPYLMASQYSGENPAKALILSGKAIARSVLSPRHWVQAGWLNAQNGNFREAFLSFEKAIFLDPGDVDAYVQKGLFLFFQVLPNVDPQKKTATIVMIEQSLSLAVQYDSSLLRSPRVSFALASVYYEKGDQDKARMIVQNADDVAISDLGFLVRKWALHFRLGDTKRPVSQWDHLFREGKLSSAEMTTLADEMAKYNIPDFHYFIAQIHLQKGETEKALHKLSSCVSERPNVIEYRLSLGDVYEKLGRPGDALAQYEKALALSPTNEYAKSKIIEHYKRR